MFPISALVRLNLLPSFSYYPEVYALILLFPKTPKRASIIKTFVSFSQCFYCFKNVNIIIRMKQKGARIYTMNTSK